MHCLNILLLKWKMKNLLWTVKFDVTVRPCKLIRNCWTFVKAICKGWIIPGVV